MSHARSNGGGQVRDAPWRADGLEQSACFGQLARAGGLVAAGTRELGELGMG
jgi:hypothetical protein